MANSPLSSQRPLSKTEISTSLNRYNLARPLLITKQAWLVLTLPFRWMLRLVYVVAAILFTPFIVAYFVIPTQKDVAYRHVHPAEPVCQTNDEPWTVLAAINSKTAAAGGEGQDGWIDPSNNEIDAIGKDEIWKRRFRCSIQHHAIAVPDNPLPDVTLPIEYHLAF